MLCSKLREHMDQNELNILHVGINGLRQGGPTLVLLTVSIPLLTSTCQLSLAVSPLRKSLAPSERGTPLIFQAFCMTKCLRCKHHL